MIGLFSVARTEDRICRNYTSAKPIIGGVLSLGLAAYAAYAACQAGRYAVHVIFGYLSQNDYEYRDRDCKWMKQYIVTVAFHAANVVTLGLLFCAISYCESD